MKTAVLALTLLAGCDLDFDFGFDFNDATIAATDDGTTLLIEGCPQSGLLGCSAPHETSSMTVLADGVTHPVPPDTVLFSSNAFVTQIPSPTQRIVSIDMNGYRTQIDLLPVFSIDVWDVFVRTDVVLPIRYYKFEDATDSIALTSQCGAHQMFEMIPVPSQRGVLDYTFPADFDALGPCQHTLRIQQTVQVPNTAGYIVTSTRTQTAWFASYP